MGTEVWFRNPDLYVRELIEVGIHAMAFDRGLLVRKHIDPDKFVSSYFPAPLNYRMLLVGEQGTAELRRGAGVARPAAVYPTWRYGDEAAFLEELVERPVGADKAICEDDDVPLDLRPVFGQEHRVVIIEPPNVATGPGRQFIKYLRALQQDHPECIIHLHGTYSWRMAFGMGLGAADVDARRAAAQGKVITPGGQVLRFERVQVKPEWLKPLGMVPSDLAEPRKRCIYNIQSAMWAGENFEKMNSFRSTPHEVDYESSDEDYKAPTGHTTTGSSKAEVGDRVACDHCSLTLSCKYYRIGAVCTVPGARAGNLARMFKTRDAQTILDGLGELVSLNVDRVQRGLDDERALNELSSETTKIIRQTFDQASKLAMLLNPSLRGGPRTQINLGQGAGGNVLNLTAGQFAQQAIEALEAQGIPREKITPQMVAGLLEGMNNPDATQQAIEGTVIHHEQSA